MFIFMKKHLLLLPALLFVISMTAQEKCGTMLLDSMRRANNPALGTLDQFETWLHCMLRKVFPQRFAHLACRLWCGTGDLQYFPIKVFGTG